MNDQLEFLDILNILSFVVGVMNYEENLTQGDKQDLMSALEEKTESMLDDIHNHLREQDEKIDSIIERMDKDARYSRSG